MKREEAQQAYRDGLINAEELERNEYEERHDLSNRTQEAIERTLLLGEEELSKAVHLLLFGYREAGESALEIFIDRVDKALKP